jgi:hypothetical protein
MAKIGKRDGALIARRPQAMGVEVGTSAAALSLRINRVARA